MGRGYLRSQLCQFHDRTVCYLLETGSKYSKSVEVDDVARSSIMVVPV